MKKTKIATLSMLVFAGSILLSACGNKGPLYTTTQEDAQTAEGQQSTTQQSAEQQLEEKKD